MSLRCISPTQNSSLRANALVVDILDEPPCGYDDKKCVSRGEANQKHIAWVMGGLLILCTFISTILYRNWKYEQEIVGLQWRINQLDLTHGNHAVVGSRVREAGLYSTSSSLTSRVGNFLHNYLHLLLFTLAFHGNVLFMWTLRFPAFVCSESVFVVILHCCLLTLYVLAPCLSDTHMHLQNFGARTQMSGHAWLIGARISS